jgi:hypothetical protein
VGTLASAVLSGKAPNLNNAVLADIAMVTANPNLPFRRVLVGYDSSSQSERALDCARDLARILHSKLVIVGVQEIPAAAGCTGLQEAVEKHERAMKISFIGFGSGV